MYLIGDRLTEQSDLFAQLKHITQLLLEDFDVGEERISLENIDDLYRHYDRDNIFLVQGGIVQLTNGQTPLTNFEEGDLAGITQSFNFPTPRLHIAEYAELVIIDRDRFLRHIYENKRLQHYWSHFLICQNALLLEQVAQIHHDQEKPHSGFQNIAAGQTIINQGAAAEHVYTILSGIADVFVDGVKVGELAEDEVFGAMAVFTHEPRSATVVAQTNCTVMAVPHDDFVHLIEAQPQAAVNLIENLSRRINMMNRQLLEKSPPAANNHHVQECSGVS